jgi:DNA-binding transcriptional MerR regulator
MLVATGTIALQIGQVAHKTGLSVDAIRFYEKSGLLPRPARTQGGYRLYEEREIADLEFIQKAQQLIFSLNEIRELFSIQRHPHQVCGHVRVCVANKTFRSSMGTAGQRMSDRAECATYPCIRSSW